MHAFLVKKSLPISTTRIPEAASSVAAAKKPGTHEEVGFSPQKNISS